MNTMDSLPPEWCNWVQVNLERDPDCGTNLLTTLLDHGFHPFPSLDAVENARISCQNGYFSIKEVEICVLVSSYRDPECVPTLKNLFGQARFADRIRIAVMSQEENHDRLILPQDLSSRRKQILIKRCKASMSRGACWARHQCQSLLQGESFALQIDSHMRFEDGWDILLLCSWLQCKDPQALLTSYPASYSPEGGQETGIFYGLAAKQFDSDGILLFCGKPRHDDNSPSRPSRPQEGAFISANFLFGPATYVRDVPYDPNLYFFGEEVSLSARLWTSGYNIYHPNRAILYHFWDRSQRATHFSDHPAWRELDTLSKARVRSLLGVGLHGDEAVVNSLQEYGLGTVRSLQEYERWSGVNFATQLISDSAQAGLFPATGELLYNANACVLISDDELVIADDFLAEKDYRELRDFLIGCNYTHINTQGPIARAWHIQDRFPLRSETSWISKDTLQYKDDRKPAWVLPTGQPIDRFMFAVESFQANNAPQVGERGKQWDEFSSTAWIYPPGTGLAMHTDGANVYSGAYVYFLNDTWRSHWGGLLVVMDNGVNRYVKEREKAQDGMAWYRRLWLHENDLEQLLLEGGGTGRVVFPKANRIVFLGNSAYHMVTRVNEEAGDCVRLSLAGFFNIQKD